MNEPDWKKTQKGRVVYERKKHKFKNPEILRLIRSTSEYFEIENEYWEEFYRDFMLLWMEKWEGFGGGRFSGGGATRPFAIAQSKSIAWPKYIYIIEEKN